MMSSNETAGAAGGAVGPAHRYTAALADAIETRWQAWWSERGTYAQPNPGEAGFDGSRPKFYCLDMFPYPSGAGLHVGHPEGYTATDIVCRYKRMRGFNVLRPMGWDAFGLPAEQYAIQTGVHPSETTRSAIDNFRRQLRRFGFSYDWSREFATIDPSYYRWTQWIWLRIYNAWFDRSAGDGAGGVRGAARPIGELVSALERGEVRVSSEGRCVREGEPAWEGARSWSKLTASERRSAVDGERLAYLSEQMVNWCPKLGTVLANEEVIDGRSERGGHPVVRRPLKQWMFRITSYAERLLEGLGRVDWPESTRSMQREWIGRSEGAYIDFEAGRRRVRVFTTRPDTVCGATYMVLAPEHPLVDELAPGSYGSTVPAGWKARGFDGAEELVSRDASPAEVISAYRSHVSGRSDVERQSEGKTKTGVFTGAYAVNPATGGRVPIFIADYVLMGYGTGAIMAVPAHDDRDFAFASAFGLPIRDVVYARPLMAMKYFFEHATEAESRGERWYWVLADMLGIVTSEESAPDFGACLERARGRRAERDDAPAATVELSSLARDVPGVVGERRGVVRMQWLETVEAFGFSGFDEAKSWFEGGEVFARLGRAFTGTGFAVGSPAIDGLATAEAKLAMVAELERVKRGLGTVQYKLRDWLFSRQRYWGEPFPVVFDSEGRHHGVSESALPVELPPLDDYTPPETDEPTPLLGKVTGWVETTAGAAGVPSASLEAGAAVTRETNTMPGWAGSCWYYLRYCDPGNADRFVGEVPERYWLGDGVDLYVGGAEHAVLHLLYARFWHKVLFDLGEVSSDEPFRKLFHQGLILSHAYQRPDGSLVPVDEVDEVAGGGVEGGEEPSAYVERATGGRVAQIVAKMSKSLRNVVNPDDVIASYGADTFRLYEMYMGPLEASKPWNTTDIQGMFRFLQRVWRLSVDESTGALRLASIADAGVEKLLHRTVSKVGEDIERLAFNTAIASMIEFVNAATKSEPGALTRDQLGRFVRVLGPFAPHVAEELWSKLGAEGGAAVGSVAEAAWPEVDASQLMDDEVEILVQVLGKPAARLMVPAGADAGELERLALADDRVAARIAGKTVRKVIAVPGKLVNIVAT